MENEILSAITIKEEKEIIRKRTHYYRHSGVS
jgi:hypothetical protein